MISTTEYNARSPDVVLAMITGSRARVERPGTGDAVIEEWHRAGLRLPSVARAGRLLVIEHRLLGLTLGQLTERDLQALDASLRTVLGLL